ncbi:MAG TPA: Wzz/FepE/Etk N-terminal domain-containing protein, partial [Thermoanaerobaculia bacterium]|nr:Wzz/FepE/Etk N-terminal domain-containing protein [Thermoanaerobaculia bacterium]
MFDENPFDAPEADAPGRAHLADYWSVLVRRRWLLAACVAAALAVAFAFSVVSRPSYRAKSVIDIGNERTAGMDLGLSETPQSPAEPDPDFQATQIRLINSMEVARRVVAKLDLAARPEFNQARRGLLGLVGRRPAPPKSAAEAQKRLVWLAHKVRSGLEVSPVHGTELVEVAYVSDSPRLSADVANAAADAYIEWK